MVGIVEEQFVLLYGLPWISCGRALKQAQNRGVVVDRKRGFTCHFWKDRASPSRQQETLPSV